jgi:hypothetical protein
MSGLIFIYLKRRKGENQPFGYPRSDPSTALRTSARDCSGLILSGAFESVLKAGASAVSSAERFEAVEVSNLSLKELRDLLNDICGYQRFLSHLSGHEIPG